MTWEILLRCGVRALPVQVGPICRALGVGLCSYGQGFELIRRFRLEGYVHGCDGFLFRLGGRPVIFYNQCRSLCRQRFTVAHELGHLALGHAVAPEGRPDPPAERAANAFAAELLSPACVLRALQVDSPGQIAWLCGLSGQAAQVRLEQLQRLYRKDQRWMEQRGRSCFFLSPAEWQLYRRFEPFIQRKKAELTSALTRPTGGTGHLCDYGFIAPRRYGAARPAGG